MARRDLPKTHPGVFLASNAVLWPLSCMPLALQEHLTLPCSKSIETILQYPCAVVLSSTDTLEHFCEVRLFDSTHRHHKAIADIVISNNRFRTSSIALAEALVIYSDLILNKQKQVTNLIYPSSRQPNRAMVAAEYIAACTALCEAMRWSWPISKALVPYSFILRRTYCKMNCQYSYVSCPDVEPKEDLYLAFWALFPATNARIPIRLSHHYHHPFLQ